MSRQLTKSHRLTPNNQKTYPCEPPSRGKCRATADPFWEDAAPAEPFVILGGRSSCGATFPNRLAGRLSRDSKFRAKLRHKVSRPDL
jgi:hypothetical protein